MTDPLPFQAVGIRKERDADEEPTVLSPARRFASAQELELRRYLNGEPIHARPAGRIERC